jgi:hypothetical protein
MPDNKQYIVHIARRSCLQVYDCLRLTVTIAIDTLIGIEVYQHS